MSAPAPALDGPRAFCRDCLGDLDFKARRCGECGSPRLVRHHALPSLTLAPGGSDARNEPTTALRVAAELGRLRGVPPEQIAADVVAAYDRLLGG